MMAISLEWAIRDAFAPLFIGAGDIQRKWRPVLSIVILSAAKNLGLGWIEILRCAQNDNLRTAQRKPLRWTARIERGRRAW
jgi:hypothetical protein